jgi:hypothetical protein
VAEPFSCDRIVASNPAAVRGDIHCGRTGDKRAGFYPAAAPF